MKRSVMSPEGSEQPRIGFRLAGVSLGLVALCWAAAWIPASAAEGRALREYEIKAAYLFKFIEYIDWPAATQAAEEPVITLCLLGDDPFGAALIPLRGKAVKDRTLKIEQIAALEGVGACQVLFISPSESERLSRILDELSDSTVLSVSEVGGSAERGVIINFVSERNKVRFEINLEAARRNGFTISSQLLKLARLVEP